MFQNHVIPSVLDAIDRQWETAVDLSALTGFDTTSFSGYTVVTKVRASENIVGGTKTRLVFRAPYSLAVTLTAVYFGEVASSGNAYDFASSPAAVQVTFGGKTSVTMTPKQRVTSDPIAFEFSPGKAHIVAMNVSTSTLRRFTAPARTRDVVSYYKSATSEAGTAAKASGYTAQADTSYGLVYMQALRIVD